jgi:mono/diheme cytochrome c family protein
MSAQPVISDTVTYGQPMTDTLLVQGTLDGQLAETFPFPVTREVMARGQSRFVIFCTPCHGALGDGKGIVAQRGLCCPASFHTDKLRSAPVGHFFDVITNGFGRMPSYAQEVPARDRWAIIAYVRALQLSQHATLGDIPPDQRNLLEAPTAVP